MSTPLLLLTGSVSVATAFGPPEAPITAAAASNAPFPCGTVTKHNGVLLLLAPHVDVTG